MYGWFLLIAGFLLSCSTERRIEECRGAEVEPRGCLKVPTERHDCDGRWNQSVACACGPSSWGSECSRDNDCMCGLACFEGVCEGTCSDDELRDERQWHARRQ